LTFARNRVWCEIADLAGDCFRINADAIPG
jgi:hypothetical protein